MSKKIGRFEILRELGRGAQSVVYLARDPHLQREVAIKTLHFSRPDPQQNRRLLEEARTVSQMRHPNIVPIFEAGEEGGDLYLVFEYVPGRNLGEYLKESGALSPVRAISVLKPVLEAVAHAHAMGVIHRDLKPSNILINDEGFPRVMDFGIAARVQSEQKGDGEGFTGTPAYMAPEYIEHRRIDARTDIFAAGLVFYELLTGRRAVQANDFFQIMHQIVNQDIRLPLDVSLDERVTTILYRALARDPEQRYESVTQMLEAIDGYLDPEEDAAASGAQGTIEFLLRRMRHKSDFPALSESVSAINKITASDRDSVAKLSSSILKDFALTNKILKLVNSAYFRQAGGGSISTVSRAVMVLGFDAVRNIAITVLLFEHLQNKGNANQLKDEFLRANLAAILAKGLGSRAGKGDVEQAFICAMFHNLGRMLTQYYFPEEGEDIRRQIEQKEISEAQASHAVLGVSFEDLGVGIAQHWGFPPLIVNSMRRLPPGAVRKVQATDEKLRVLAAFSNELCAVIASAAPEDRQKELKKVTARFSESVPISHEEMQKTLEKSFEEVAQFASVIRLNLQQTPFGRQIRAWGGKRIEAVAGDAASTHISDDVADTLGGAALVETPSFPDTEGAPNSAEHVEAILTAGIRDISNSLVEDFSLNDVLRIILETMYRAKGFRRVILCIKDVRSGAMQGRFGFGPEATEIARKFRFPLAGTPDIFLGAMTKGVDILISDVNDPKIAGRVPEWYRKSVGAGTFVLFPLTIKSNPVALIYADMEEPGAIVIPEKELSLFRTLRNQALLAIKQAM